MKHYRIAANIRVAIDHIGGQSAVARIVGVSQPAVRKWYINTNLPKREHIESIAEHLEVHPTVLEFGDLAAELGTRPRTYRLEPNWKREGEQWVRYWTANDGDYAIAAIVAWMDKARRTASWVLIHPEGDESVSLPRGVTDSIGDAKKLADTALGAVEAMLAGV